MERTQKKAKQGSLQGGWVFFKKQGITSLKHWFQVCSIHTHHLAEESHFQKRHTNKKSQE